MSCSKRFISFLASAWDFALRGTPQNYDSVDFKHEEYLIGELSRESSTNGFVDDRIRERISANGVEETVD